MKPIKEAGVRPDVVVDMTSQALRDPSEEKVKTPKEDLILNKALSLFGAAPQAAAKKVARHSAWDGVTALAA
jgi:hypothetical protein